MLRELSNPGQDTFDVAIVGMGIVGLAHAYAAVRLGLKVLVVDREARNIGASIRNFGFVTVTGQKRGEMWQFARRTRDVWLDVAHQAAIKIDQKGLLLVGQRPEATDVIGEFISTEMGAECALYTEQGVRERYPDLPLKPFHSALYSPFEVRVDPRSALPKLAAWLEETWNVEFSTQTAVYEVDSGKVSTSRGVFRANKIFVCTGDDLSTLFPKTLARRKVTRSQLNMLRLRDCGPRFPFPIMSDLSLVRYDGFNALKAAGPLRTIIDQEAADARAAGVHLIVVQSADGSLVVGDSHVYSHSPLPFQDARIDQLIVKAFDDVFCWEDVEVIERWIGSYPYSPDHPWFSEEVARGVHLTLVTTGAGMSTAFAIAEKTVSEATELDLEEAL